MARGNPNMKKGEPSVNPSGKAPGGDGIPSFGGAVWSPNQKQPKPERFGSGDAQQLIVESAAIATAVRLWLLLVGSCGWSTQQNPSNSTDAKRCDELVYNGLIKRPGLGFRAAIRRQATKKFLGHAVHAKGFARDSKGSIVVSELGWRPQWTIEQFLKVDDAPWHAVKQRSPSTGKEIDVARGDLWYSVEGDLTPEPYGLGVLRHLRHTWEILDRYRQLQAQAFDTDVNGVPVIRVPYSELAREAVATKYAANESDHVKIAEYIGLKTRGVREFVSNRRRSPDQWLSLPSTPYFGIDADQAKKPSAVFQWNLEILKTAIGSIPEMRAAMGDLNREIYRLLVAEHVMMGEGEGSRAVATDKTDMLMLAVGSLLDDIAEDLNRDVIPDLVARNGYDPETCAPTVLHEPLAKKSALAVAQMLKALTEAKLSPKDEAIAIVRGMDELPPPPEVDEDEEEPEPKPDPKSEDKEPS